MFAIVCSLLISGCGSQGSIQSTPGSGGSNPVTGGDTPIDRARFQGWTLKEIGHADHARLS
ncbi:MAG: hypothetical protein ACR2NZ_13145, partial [Rubripirellula sp.]